MKQSTKDQYISILKILCVCVLLVSSIALSFQATDAQFTPYPTITAQFTDQIQISPTSYTTSLACLFFLLYVLTKNQVIYRLSYRVRLFLLSVFHVVKKRITLFPVKYQSRFIDSFSFIQS